MTPLWTLPDNAQDVLGQMFLKGPIDDGDVSSKSGRDWLVENGLAIRCAQGYQTLTAEGVVTATSEKPLGDGIMSVSWRRKINGKRWARLVIADGEPG